MKKIIISVLLILSLCFSSYAYVYPRENITLEPKIDGQLTGGISRNNDGTSIQIVNPSGISPTGFGYVSYNTTDYFRNSTLSYRRIENIYSRVNIVAMSNWDAPDALLFRRLNKTDINSTFPTPLSLSTNILSGDDYTSGTQIGWSVGEIRDVDINFSGVAESDLFNQVNNGLDGGSYFSLGWEEGSDLEDESITINSSEGGYSPKLIIETSCLPKNNSNWIINETCIITNENVSVGGNLTIAEAGNLILNGTAQLNFTKPKSEIRIKPVGQLSLADSAEIRFSP